MIYEKRKTEFGVQTILPRKLYLPAAMLLHQNNYHFTRCSVCKALVENHSGDEEYSKAAYEASLGTRNLLSMLLCGEQSI